MNRLLIISPDVVAEKMAGPGIRYWEMSRALARYFDVTLAIPNRTDLQSPNVRLETYSRSQASSMERLVAVVGGVVPLDEAPDVYLRLPVAAAKTVPSLLHREDHAPVSPPSCRSSVPDEGGIPREFGRETKPSYHNMLCARKDMSTRSSG